MNYIPYFHINKDDKQVIESINVLWAVADDLFSISSKEIQFLFNK